MLRALTIAGSDPTAGAGLQADLKTFAAHGVYGLSAVTAVTVQSTVAVAALHPVQASVLLGQIESVVADIGVDAVKIGMLGGSSQVEAVARALDILPAVPVVLDPVLRSTSGTALLDEEATSLLMKRLWPRVDLATPNRAEAETLLGRAIEGEADQLRAAESLRSGSNSVLVTGGDAGGAVVVDTLAWDGGTRSYRAPRIETRAGHGTGCTLSSSVAARLAAGESHPDAVEGAIDYVRRCLRAAPQLGKGSGPLQHFPGPESV